MLASSSGPRCAGLPAPPDAKVYLPGSAFASAMNSASVFAGMKLLIRMICGLAAIMPTGTKSFTGS